MTAPTLERKLIAGLDVIRGVNAKDHTIEATITRRVVDRDLDVVEPRGLSTSAYLDNPTLLDHHKHTELPIGRALALDVTDEDITALFEFASHPRARQIETLYAEKMLRAFSIGFLVEKIGPPVLKGARRTIEIAELVEVSAVSVPSNRLALAKMLSLPDGATERDLLVALGRIPTRKFYDLAQSYKEDSLMPDPTPTPDPTALALKAAEDRAALAESRLAVLERARGDDGERFLLGGQKLALGRGAVPSPFGDRAPGVIHSQGEAPYSFARAVIAIAKGDKSLAPVEVAFSKRLERCGFQAASNGLMVPLGADALWRVEGHEQELDALAVEWRQQAQYWAKMAIDPDEYASFRRKAMTGDDDTLGGALVGFPGVGDLISLMRPKSWLALAGAKSVPLPPSGGLYMPAERGDAVFTYLAPNQTIPPSDPATGSVSLAAKRAGALVLLPNDLTRYSAGLAESVVRNGLAQRAARTEDLTALEGIGASNTPQGLTRYDRTTTNAPVVGKVTGFVGGGVGADGNVLLPGDVGTILALVEESNAEGATAFVMRPLMFSGIANARADAVSAGDAKGMFLFTTTTGNLALGIPDTLRGVPALKTTTVSNTMRKGAATNLTYVLAGDFRNFYVGRVGAVEIAASADYAFASDQLAIRALLRHDMAPSHPEAFVIASQLVIPS